MSIPAQYTDSLYVVESPGKGRSLYTQHFITPATIIAHNQLYLHTINDAHIKHRCSQCFAVLSKPLCCSLCKQKYYCNTTCQRLAWRHNHWLECYALTQVRPTDGECHSSAVLLLLQLVLEQVQKHSIEDVQLTDELSTFSQLCNHVDAIADTAQKQLDINDYADMVNVVHGMITALVTAIKQAKDGERNRLLSPTMREKLMAFDDEFIQSSLIDKSKLLFDMNRLQCNLWTVSDSDDLDVYGCGLSLFFALINHSCVPNTMLTFDGTTAVLRALQPIAADTELSYTYIDLMSTTADRREKLQTQYAFVCQCDRCKHSETDAGKQIEYLLTAYMCNNTIHPTDCAGFLIEHSNPELLKCTVCKQTQAYSDVRRCQSDAIILLDQSGDAFEHDDVQQAIKLVKQAISRMLNNVHDNNLFVYQMLSKLSLYSNTADDFETLLPTLLAMLYAMKTCLPAVHAQLALHYKTIGDVAFQLQDRLLAVQHYMLARDMLTVTHGKDSAVVTECAMKLTALKAGGSSSNSQHKYDTTNMSTLLKPVL